MLLYFLAVFFLVIFSITVWWTYFELLGYKYYFSRQGQLDYLKNNPQKGAVLIVFIIFYPFLIYLDSNLPKRLHAPATIAVVYALTFGLFQLHYQSQRVKKTRENKGLSDSTKKYLIYFYYFLLGVVVIGLLLFAICMDFNIGSCS